MAKNARSQKQKMIKVKATNPATASIQLQDEIKKLITADSRIVKKLKPEVKYLDLFPSETFFFGSDVPFQKALVYPSNGWITSNRIGSKIENVRLQLRGQLRGNALNVVGGIITFYILYYKRQRSIATGSYYDAIANTGGIGPFLLADAGADFTQMSLRDFDHMQDWQVMGKKSMVLKPDQLASANPTRNFSLNCKLKDIKFDASIGNTNTIVDGMCQIFAIASFGEAPVGSTDALKLASTGYNMSYNYRITYTDS